MSILPFQWLVREISHNCLFVEEGMRWQANDLFALQSVTEAYMAGFYSDVNECAHHRRVKTINLKDIFLAVSTHGREHIGGHSQVSDVGAANVSGITVADSSERRLHHGERRKHLLRLQTGVLSLKLLSQLTQEMMIWGEEEREERRGRTRNP